MPATFPNGRMTDLAMPRRRNGGGQRIRFDSGARMNDNECCCDSETNCCSTASVTIDGALNDGCTNCGNMNATHVRTVLSGECDENNQTGLKCIAGQFDPFFSTMLCGDRIGGASVRSTGWTLYVEFNECLGNYLFVDIAVNEDVPGQPFLFFRKQRWSITLPGFPICDGREYELTLESSSALGSVRCDISNITVTIAFN